MKVKKDSPTSSMVHVSVPLGSEEKKIKKDADETQDNQLSALHGIQSIIEGIDWEMRHTTKDLDQAKENAISELEKDPNFYKKITKSPIDESGLNIDLGSGNARAMGHIGFDQYPHDHGTIIHDLENGIPLTNSSALRVKATNSIHDIGSDIKDVLEEISRVLVNGGEFEYQGPEDLTAKHPNLVLVSHEDNVGKSVDEPTFSQKYINVIDPATANGAEPKGGIRYNDLTPEELFSSYGMGYYWSDQGELITKGGPGSGPHEGGGTSAASYLHNRGDSSSPPPPSKPAPVDHKKNIAEKELKTQRVKSMMLSAKMAADRAPAHEKEQKSEIYRKYVNHFHHVKDEYHQAIKEHINHERSLRGAGRLMYSKSCDSVVKVMKAESMKQLIYGVVLAPDEVDFQEDYMTAQDIETAAHGYLIKSRIVGEQHEKEADADIVESYIAPQELKWEGLNGIQIVKKGSWVIGVKVNDPAMWQKVLKGEITGFSVGGMGERV